MWTDEQRHVIHSGVRNQVVFAAPGSGKTAVLISHIATILRNRIVVPSDIAALTFTRQAAQEMRQRLQRLPNLSTQQVESVSFGTFHAQVFRWLLRLNPDIPVILRETEQRKWLQRAANAKGLNRFERLNFLSMLALSKSTWPATSPPAHVEPVLREYERLKRTYRRWDFDDILMEFCHLLDGSRMTRIPQYKYILVDEFQDTNQIQWHILNSLQERTDCKLFVVGDDDQSIYSFRGTSPKWLLQFHQQLPAVSTHYLSTNFRSASRIVQTANTLIEHNQERVHKQIGASSKKPGTCIMVAHRGEPDEDRYIARHITANCSQDDTLKRWPVTVAVLARTRAQLARIHGAYVAHGRVANCSLEFRTFHDSKGREWDVVHILDAVEASPYVVKLPSRLDEWEEERRLFYVAMTRARHDLYVHFPMRLQSIRMRLSSFVRESGMSQ